MSNNKNKPLDGRYYSAYVDESEKKSKSIYKPLLLLFMLVGIATFFYVYLIKNESHPLNLALFNKEVPLEVPLISKEQSEKNTSIIKREPLVLEIEKQTVISKLVPIEIKPTHSKVLSDEYIKLVYESMGN
ncbi:MAG: Unknown protein [uncultured Sulfurovum sp.]|uniref:Uncharacterized protein n=1 Tax=uncultured Sulfurovum sp. TaxID=269237 RepID=A0A6S6T1D7_9BACT|nr:MAG: Unknown protein [uncultured Sulfurovum sp.]